MTECPENFGVWQRTTTLFSKTASGVAGGSLRHHEQQHHTLKGFKLQRADDVVISAHEVNIDDDDLLGLGDDGGAANAKGGETESGPDAFFGLPSAASLLLVMNNTLTNSANASTPTASSSPHDAIRKLLADSLRAKAASITTIDHTKKKSLLLLPPANTNSDPTLVIPFAPTSSSASIPHSSSASFTPQTYSESHAIKSHKQIMGMIMNGTTASQNGGNGGPSEKALVALLRLSGLIPQAGAGGSAASPIDGATSSSNSSNMNTTISPFGLTFCMASKAQQWWYLLWSAAQATISAMMSQNNNNTADDGSSASSVTNTLIAEIVATVATCDAGLVYRVPPPSSGKNGNGDDINAVARQLLNRLALVGLCFPFKRKGNELFIVSPFMRLAAASSSNLNSNPSSAAAAGAAAKDSSSSYAKCSAVMKSAFGISAPTSTAASDCGDVQLSHVQPHHRRVTVKGMKRSRAITLDDGHNNKVEIEVETLPISASSAAILEAMSQSSDNVGSTSSSSSSADLEGSIVTETNFRLYVYSSEQCESGTSAANSSSTSTAFSAPLLNIVSQFADHDLTIPHRHVVGPNKVPYTETFSVFRLTRPAFARAHRRGISAAQIIQFLTLKAHSSSINSKNGKVAGIASAVPPSVQDQLKMWQQTCERVDWSLPANTSSDPNGGEKKSGNAVTSANKDTAVMLTFPDTATMERVVGLGVPIVHRSGLRVVMKYSDFVKSIAVGNV